MEAKFKIRIKDMDKAESITAASGIQTCFSHKDELRGIIQVNIKGGSPEKVQLALQHFSEIRLFLKDKSCVNPSEADVIIPYNKESWEAEQKQKKLQKTVKTIDDALAAAADYKKTKKTKKTTKK